MEKSNKEIEAMKKMLDGFVKNAEKNGNFFVLAISSDGTITEGFTKGYELEFPLIAKAIAGLPKDLMQMALVFNMTGQGSLDKGCDDEDCPVHGKKGKKVSKKKK